MSIYHSSTDITGRLGKDIEVKKGASGKEFAPFSIAVQRFVGQGKDPETVWHDAVAFSQTAQFLGSRAKKGDWIRVIGEYVKDSWVGEDGAERQSMRLLVNRAFLIGRTEWSATGEAAGTKTATSGKKTVGSAIAEEEIPF